MGLAAQLKTAIQNAGVAITDVAIGSDRDRATWRVRPEDLQAAAQATIDSFDPDDPAVIDAEKTALAAQLDTMAAVQAIAQLDFEERQKLVVKPGQSLRTAAECKDRAKAIYKGLLS